MSEPTKTISIRLSLTVHQQIGEVAQSLGLSEGEWVRDQAMRALHELNPQSEAEPPKQPTTSELSANLIRAFDERVQKAETGFRQEIEAVKAAIREAAKSHHQSLATAAEVGMTAEQSMEERIEASGNQILTAIARLEKLQRSSKNAVLYAIAELTESDD